MEKTSDDNRKTDDNKEDCKNDFPGNIVGEDILGREQKDDAYGDKS